jgi:TPP-dependent pyruvate/acetoin dehydrogenase alpha subunit
MGTQADEGAAYDNPLIPNARLRQIYLSMAQVRTLALALPSARRGQRPAAGTLGLEAALVSATVDLGAGDMVSDALAGGVVDFLRGTSLKEVLRAGKAGASASRRSRKSGTGVRGLVAECGTAVRLPGIADAAERIWAALGAAAALKAAAQARVEAKAKAEVKAKATDMAEARQAGVVVVYALVDEVPAALWKRALRFAAEQGLPVVFVALPAARARGGKARAGGVSALARGCGVPAIAVDADDAVAIYRVAQESIGHARMGGGAALMECVPFVLEGAAGKGRQREDAIAALERTIVQRGVAARAWMEREAKAFAKRLAK